MLISIAEYARRRGCTYQGVAAAIRTGRVSLIDGKIDPAVADIQWDENRRRAPNVKDTAAAPRPSRTPAGPSDSDDLPLLEESRRRREFHEANLAAMREGQRAGELVELAQVHLAYTTLAAQLRSALERIPDKLAPRLALAEPDLIHELLTTELDAAMADMAQTAAELPERLAAAAQAAA